MTPYDLGLRVPFIWAGPGIRAGTSDALASELDLMPTLLDLAGLEVPKGLHGVSLRAVLEGQPGARPRAFVFAKISNRGNLPNDGMQERTPCPLKAPRPPLTTTSATFTIFPK